MSDLFEECEKELNKIVNSIERMMTNFPHLSQDKKESTLSDIQYDLNEADQQIKQMDIEISSHPVHMRQQLQQKLKRYRNEWDSLKKKRGKLQEDLSRETLMDTRIELQTRDSSSSVDSQSGKEKFIKTGAMMSDGTQKLKGALRDMYQVENVSNEANNQIYNQNNQLKKMISDNRDIYNDLNDSNRLVDRMKKNIQKNKLVLCAVTAILVIALIVIICTNV